MSNEVLAQALREAAAAHHEYEKTLGHPDEDWAGWYAKWINDQIVHHGGLVRWFNIVS